MSNLSYIAATPVAPSDLLAEALAALATGDLICVGGHQSWPSRPSAHAVKSIALCQSLVKKRAATSMRVFLDDIGAAAACAGATCNVAAGRSQPLELPGMDEWCIQHLDAVARALAHRQSVPNAAVETLRDLCSTLVERPLVCERLLRLSPEKSLHDWTASVEMLVYAAARQHFLPLQLIAATGIEPVSAVLERAMSNAASRTLHKTIRRGGQTRLRLERDAEKTRYWADLPSSLGGPLLLRREDEQAGMMAAANYCGALLAQLFFTLCRPSLVSSLEKARTILYVIPCYDRARVRQGMHAFFEVFCDLRQWFGLEQVTLISLWETGNPRVPYALDSLSATNNDAQPHYRPAFVKARGGI